MQGTQLRRYSARFSCVEINTSFYRSHRIETYARWAASVPEGFLFAVKTPRTITHEARLVGARAALTAFLAEIAALGFALGPVLVQLPPSLAYQPGPAEQFVRDLREVFAGPTVLEPRHPTWFEADPDRLLRDYRIGRAGADPAPVPAASDPGGWDGLRYFRLHGSPRMYHTLYGEDRLRSIAASLDPGDWAILDNTASGAAVFDALRLQALCARPAPQR